MKRRDKRTAFSLIEVAIVLLFMGILSAGIVLTRTSFFSNAKNNRLTIATKNSPLKDMNDLVIWLDVSTNESFKNSEIIDGGLISVWKNISPQNYGNLNVEETNTGRQPIYSLDAKDKLPMLFFDDVDDRLRTVNSINGFDFGRESQLTIISVQRRIASSNTAVTLNWGTNNNKIRLRTMANDNIQLEFGDVTVNGRTIAVANNTNNQWNIVTGVKKVNNSSQIRLNGVTLVTDLTVDNNINLSNSGIIDVGLGFGGNLREVIFFKRELTPSEITEVEKYLSKKWKIKI